MMNGDWQLPCTEMKQRGAHLLQSGQWSDCTFLVGTEPHQVIVNGHKLILAMASPVFEAMFYGGMAERNEPIPILDVQPEAFKALLEYIYTDNININSFDKACELCYGAKKYMLPHLVKECTRYLWSDLYPRNACRAYEFARLFEENVLMEKCIQIISTNTKEVLTDSSFEEVDLNTVITVFSLDHLNVDSELDLFEAAVRYARAQDKRGERSISPARRPSPGPTTSKDKAGQVVNIESSAENSPVCVTEACKSGEGDQESTPSGSEEKPSKDTPAVPEDKNKKIRAAIEKIRFLTLTPQQFAEGPARSSLLTESEAFAVLMNILSSSSDVTMPAGFSTCRVPRKQLIGGHQHTSANMPTFTVDTPSPVMVDQVFGCDARAPLSARGFSQENYGALQRPARLDVDSPCNIRHASSSRALRQGVSTNQVRQTVGRSHASTAFTNFFQEHCTNLFGRSIRIIMIELHLGVLRSSAIHNQSGVSGLNMNPVPVPASAVYPPLSGLGPGLDHVERGSDITKIYCQRAIIQQTDCLNTSVLDCSVTFMVDKNICLLGVQVPTQAPSEESAVSREGVLAGAGGYCELLYAHLLDADGARLTYTHYTSRVPYRHLLDIMFNRPVYVQRNKVYKVGIVFNKVGWYPLGTCAQQVAAESVFFNFGIGQSADSVRDGLIRSIIFTY